MNLEIESKLIASANADEVLFFIICINLLLKMFKGASIKILIIGPPQSGKSRLANYIADREDISSNGYRPTAGVRILEFEKEAPKNPKRPGSEKVIVELWDVSGD